MRRLLLFLGVSVIGIAAPSSAAVAQTPFGHQCTAQADGVRFCPTTDGSAGQTLDGVPSFDGVPLDVDVTLPPPGTSGPYPTIVMLHGYGGEKTAFEATEPAGDESNTFHYNNDYFARQGYAVVNYTARGFGHSCGGGPAGYHSGPCGQGYIRLADTRYEARDTQYLLGLLVDQGFVKPHAIGVTGISYGGGQSLELAYLRNRIRKPDGSFAPWTSPKGKSLSITAAWPRWPWSDLVDALLPNGRFLDTQVAPTGQSLGPVGIPIASYVSGLYALGKTTGYYCGDAPASAPCTNPDADLTADFALVNAGEPPSPLAEERLAEIYAHHQAYGLSGRPAPLLIENGWTDDLFPPEQAIRIYDQASGSSPVSLQFGDLGHSRGSNKPTVNHAFNEQGAAFFDRHLRGGHGGPAAGSVTAYTQTCPASEPDGGPYSAPSYGQLHTAAVTFGSAATQLVTASGDPVTSAQLDPIGGTTDACKSVTPTPVLGTASYEQPTKSGFTMLGLPTVTATIQTLGEFGQLDSMLFDVAADGSERLVTRGAYRLTGNQSGPVTFQLHGNGYAFAPGHTAKLVLLGSDAPYLRPSNDLAFSVQVSKLKVSLPTVG
ncbi:MAG: type transport system ATP-binding protein [Solirubrobacterales bacterium]|nr:type transport system ATP-binding protein [Solirubrobacterales bacterium]